MWSPFKYLREQRERDREVLLVALDKLMMGQARQADVAIEQARALRAFIDSYMNITGAPSSRVCDDESEYEAERLEWGLHGES